MSRELDYNAMRQTLQTGEKLTAPKTKSGEIANTVGKVVKTGLMNAPYIQNALGVLDGIVDIGQSMPFVQPAFVLFKFIIEVEKKAQEADAKCKDLVERITFMLSHLPMLKNVKVVEPTKLVIERMDGALKDAAALIAAYRKQDAVARRLHVNNKDKFSTCAEAINGCSKDLMMSLQIHQTTQLDILTRTVPVDPEDEAAQAFVASHGSLDAVKKNPDLVKEFAKEQHLTMDDEVMVQLNTNLTDTMEQTMGRLEDMVKGNVSEAIIDGLKGLAAEMAAKEAQQRFKCVQCDKEYTESTNGTQSCSFHRAAYSSQSKSYPCCSSSHPCQFRSHRAVHHCDYPYSTFFDYARGITWYSDTVTKWAEVEDKNLENNSVENAFAGRLLRWASRADRIQEQIMLIKVGALTYDSPYYFNTFTVNDLESVAQTVRDTQQTVIYRTSASDSEYTMAEWVLSPVGAITGVRLTAKAATSETAFIREFPLDVTTCTKSGDVVTLSEGGMHSYKPATPYVLPENIRIGPELSDVQLRRPRTNFKTRTSPSLRVILKTMSDPPLTANPALPVSYLVDYFQGEVTVFNNHPAGTSNPVTIASASAAFRLVGDNDYLPVEEFKIIDNSQLPITVDPRQSWRFKFQASVPRTQEDAQLKIEFWKRSFVARYRPLRLKLILEDIEGEECSIVLEYVFNAPYPFALDKPKGDDLAFLYFDDPIRWNRHTIRVSKHTYTSGILEIDGKTIDAKQLEMIVHKALKTGETELDLNLTQARDASIWEWGAWALVDLSCRRVYAFKILLKEGGSVKTKRFACLGYVLCPDYGRIIDETRPIRCGVEKVTPPDLEPYTEQTFVTDDTVDDFVAEPTKVAPMVGNGILPTISGASLQSGDIATLNMTLCRIADGRTS